MLVYQVPVPLGNYVVRLHFANTVSTTTTVGSRVFNVFVGNMNTAWLPNFDIIKACGDLTGGTRARTHACCAV